MSARLKSCPTWCINDHGNLAGRWASGETTEGDWHYGAPFTLPFPASLDHGPETTIQRSAWQPSPDAELEHFVTLPEINADIPLAGIGDLCAALTAARLET